MKFMFIFSFILIQRTIIKSQYEISYDEACKEILGKYNMETKCKFKQYTERFVSLAKNAKCVCKNVVSIPNSISDDLMKLVKENNIRFNIYFKLRKRMIMDRKFQMFNIDPFYLANSQARYEFRYIKGFDVDSFISKNISVLTIIVKFFESSLNFYLNGRILKTCDDFSSFIKPNSLFQLFKTNDLFENPIGFYFINTKFKSSICPMAFRNAQISVLTLEPLIDTFYKKNIPSFYDLPNVTEDINANIYALTLHNCENVHINKRILNPNLLNQTILIIFYGEILSINKGTFKSLRNLKYLQFYEDTWRKLVHNGLEWTLDFNPGIKVDLNNSTLMKKSEDLFVIIEIYIKLIDFNDGLRKDRVRKEFPEEDLCLYYKLPFDQLVFVVDVNYYEKNMEMTCTYVWLIQFYPILPISSDIEFLNNKLNISLDLFPQIGELKVKCNFEKRLVKTLFLFNYELHLILYNTIDSQEPKPSSQKC